MPFKIQRVPIFPWLLQLLVGTCVVLYGKGEGIMVRIHRIVKFLVCIGLITLLSGCAATQNRESTGEYIDDSVITAEAKNVIFNEPSLKVFQISVETYKGIVQLSGFVDSQQAVDKVGEIVKSVKGVKSIKNNLIVK